LIRMVRKDLVSVLYVGRPMIFVKCIPCSTKRLHLIHPIRFYSIRTMSDFTPWMSVSKMDQIGVQL
jgi:hypothetical protein